ncbi:MAG: hypothetical protein ACRDDZ_12980 [Marinifilaceae bacterium]
MKAIIKIVLLTVAIIMSCDIVMGQERSKERLTREELAKVQAKAIVQKLSMNADTGRQFQHLYVEFQKEIWALGPRLKPNDSNLASTKNDDETKQEIEKRFERSKKILEIRQKYYIEYSKFLSQKDIKSIYQLEREIMERLSKSRPTTK